MIQSKKFSYGLLKAITSPSLLNYNHKFVVSRYILHLQASEILKKENENNAFSVISNCSVNPWKINGWKEISKVNFSNLNTFMSEKDKTGSTYNIEFMYNE